MNRCSDRFQKYSLLLFAIIFLLLLTIVSAFKFYLPSEIQRVINEAPLAGDFEFMVQNVRYDFINGFVFEDIILKTENGEGGWIEIDSASVDVNFLCSVLKRKIVLDSVHIDNLGASVSEKFVRTISDINGNGFEEKSSSKSLEELLYIDEIIIDSLAITYGGKYPFNLSDFHVVIGEFNHRADIAFSTDLLLMDYKFHLKGNLKFSGEMLESSLDVTTNAVNITGLEKLDVPPLLIKSGIKADLKNRIRLDAGIDIHRLDAAHDDNPAGFIKLLSEYNHETSDIEINRLEIDAGKLFKISSSGVIKNIDDGAVADISGEVQELNVDKLYSILSDNFRTKLGMNIDENKFKITGSVPDNTLNISGNLRFSDTTISIDDALLQAGVAEGELEYKYYIQAAKDYSNINLIMKSANTEVRHIPGFLLDSEFSYRFGNDAEKGLLKLNARSSNFAGGYIELDTNIDFSTQRNPISGNIIMRGLDLSKLKFPYLDMEGGLKNSSIRYGGNFSEIGMDAELDLENIELKQHKTFINKVSTATPVNTTLKISDENMGMDKLTLKVHELYVSGINYDGILVENIVLDFNSSDLLDDGVPLVLSMTGEKLDYTYYDLMVDEFELYAEGKIGVNESLAGDIGLSSLNIKDFLIDNVTGKLSYQKENLDINDLKIRLNDTGTLNIPVLNISTTDSVPFPSKLYFKNGYFLPDLTKDKISGMRLDIKKLSTDKWSGSLAANNIRLGKLSMDNFMSPLVISDSNVHFGNFKSKLYGGRLEGYVSYNNSPGKQILDTNIKLYELRFNNQNPLNLGELNLRYYGAFSEDNSIPNGNGTISFKNLYFRDYQEDSVLSGSVDLVTQDETMSFENGLIDSEQSSLLNFSGGLVNPLESERILRFETNNIDLMEIKKFLNPLLPVFVRYGEIEGDMGVKFEAMNIPRDTTVVGHMDFKKVSIKGDPFSTYFNLENLNGRLDFNESVVEMEDIQETISRHTMGYKDAYKYVLQKSETDLDKPTLSLDRVEYGFFKLEKIKMLVRIIKNKLVFKTMNTELFKGKLYVSGIYNLSDKAGTNSKLSLLFKNMSQNNISESIPGTEGYMSGRFNGLMSLAQKRRRSNELDGLFDFWAVKSADENRKVGRAFLERLGARERFFLGSDKSYDKGELRGYINNGIITFSELEISNSFLGINDLYIKVHKKRNSISVNHLLSVIRETARRVEKGTVDFEFKN